MIFLLRIVLILDGTGDVIKEQHYRQIQFHLKFLKHMIVLYMSKLLKHTLLEQLELKAIGLPSGVHPRVPETTTPRALKLLKQKFYVTGSCRFSEK